MKILKKLIILGLLAGSLSAYTVVNPPTFTYPAKAEEVLATSENDKVLIFAYGSLISTDSAGRTLSKKALETSKPVTAHYLKRVFDYSPVTSPERGMLNVHATPDPNDVVNGVVYEVDKGDLQNLISRERGYDLIPVIVEPWTNPDGQFAIAYTFSAPDEPRAGRVYTDSKVKPYPVYYDMVKAAANQYGPDFLSLWLETTYLADGKTPVKDWELTR